MDPVAYVSAVAGALGIGCMAAGSLLGRSGARALMIGSAITAVVAAMVALQRRRSKASVALAIIGFVIGTAAGAIWVWLQQDEGV
jgi:uncharacterized membrane protein